MPVSGVDNLGRFLKKICTCAISNPCDVTRDFDIKVSTSSTPREGLKRLYGSEVEAKLLTVWEALAKLIEREDVISSMGIKVGPHLKHDVLSSRWQPSLKTLYTVMPEKIKYISSKKRNNRRVLCGLVYIDGWV